MGTEAVFYVMPVARRVDACHRSGWLRVVAANRPSRAANVHVLTVNRRTPPVHCLMRLV
jgi:hypothetical protein